MEEWNIVTVIIALVGFISSICVPILKLNTNIVKLTAAIDFISNKLNNLESKNKSQFENIYGLINEHEKRINNLEK